MRQTYLFLILTTLLALAAQAQVFIPGDPAGSTATYRVTYGKEQSLEETQTLVRVEGNRVWYQTGEVADDEVPDYSVRYSAAGFTLSMKELKRLVREMTPDVAEAVAKIELASDFGDRMRMLPLQGKAGETFPVQTLSVRVRAILLLDLKIRISLLDDHIDRLEQAQTPFGTRQLLVRKFTLRAETDTKVFGKRERETTDELKTQWIIPGRGLYKEETRTSDGKLKKTMVLIDFHRALTAPGDGQKR